MPVTESQPTWGVTDAKTDPPDPAAGPSGRPTRSVVGGVVLGVATLIGGAVVFSRDAPPTSEESPVTNPDLDTLDTSASITTAVITSASGPTVTVPPSTSGIVTSQPPQTQSPDTLPPTTSPATTLPPTTLPPENPGNESAVTIPDDQRGAVFRNGTIYLSGEVPSQAVSDELVRRVGLVIGPDNVVANHTIRPGVEVSETSVLFIEDVVLFSPGSAEITDPFKSLLDLGTLLFQVNPAVTITVEAHTDSIGSQSTNLYISQLRADAVKDYWIGAGVDPDRITAIGRGETEPYTSNRTSEGRQLNRRAEFTIFNFLG
ncbi:MAG: OmpA family protein [Acidimicrobiales bacterium]|nr:OmpA family protein [Acidimicrobiales bacterium]